jgi:succinoglycan biosynthesis protein ExoM
MTITHQRAGIAVGMCTYKRLASLQRTLQHTAEAIAHLGQPVQVIVVDNDGQDPAVGAAVLASAEKFGLKIHYVVEPAPGISAARNAIFAKAEELGVRFLAMIDDDEWPLPEWLVELLRTQATTGAVVVGGPVRPIFPDWASPLRRYARYWSVEPQFLDNKPFVFCSCNFMIDLQAIANEPRPLFDEVYGLSGGGDTAFFRKLFLNGCPMAWSESALLEEEVPDSRASFAWMRKRRFRVGNHMARLEISEDNWKAWRRTLGLTARLTIYPWLRREPESPFVGWLLEFEKVRGRYASHIGSTFVEYARPQAPGEKACG